MKDKIEEKKNAMKDLLNKGYRKLKPHYCHFRFHAEPLVALSCFKQAAEGFKQIGAHEEYLLALQEEAKLNHSYRFYWEEANNYKDMAYAHLDVDSDEEDSVDLDELGECLANANVAFCLGGKFRDGVQLYNTVCSRLLQKKKLKEAFELICSAFDDCVQHATEDLVRIALEDTVSLLLDVGCQQRKFGEVILRLSRYIQAQLAAINESKAKISKNYKLLALMRIITKEIYLAEKILPSMYEIYDESCKDDIDDTKKAIQAFKEMNRNDFLFCLNYSFCTLPNGLVKALKAAYEEKEKEDNPNYVPLFKKDDKPKEEKLTDIFEKLENEEYENRRLTQQPKAKRKPKDKSAEEKFL